MCKHVKQSAGGNGGADRCATLLTDEQRTQLLANSYNRGADHVPVIKLIHPISYAAWLFTELDPDGDTLFGLCDLGMGFPELGYASLADIEAIGRRSKLLPIVHDPEFVPRHPLSVYAKAARRVGRIPDDETLLAAVAAALAADPQH